MVVINHGNLDQEGMNASIYTGRPQIQEAILTIKFTEGDKSQFFKMNKLELKNSFQKKFKDFETDCQTKYIPQKLGGTSMTLFKNFFQYMIDGFIDVEEENIIEYTYCAFEFQCQKLLQRLLQLILAKMKFKSQKSFAKLVFLIIEKIDEFDQKIDEFGKTQRQDFLSLLKEFMTAKAGVNLFYIEGKLIDDLFITDENFRRLCRFFDKDNFKDNALITQFCLLAKKYCKSESTRDLCLISMLEDKIDPISFERTLSKYFSDKGFYQQCDRLEMLFQCNMKYMNEKIVKLTNQINLEDSKADLDVKRKDLQNEARVTSEEKNKQNNMILEQMPIQENPRFNSYIRKPKIEIEEAQSPIFHDSEYCKCKNYLTHSCGHLNCLNCLFEKTLTKQKHEGTDFSTFKMRLDIVCLSNYETKCSEKFIQEDYKRLFELVNEQ